MILHAGSDKISAVNHLGKLRLDGKMRWFRDNIGQGAWLALVALVINLGLSFGHVHAIEAKCSEHGLISLIAGAKPFANPHHGRKQGQPDQGHADFCPICTAAASMASPLASAPPSLPLHFAAVILDRPIESVRAVVDPPTAAFQSRGPPIS